MPPEQTIEEVCVENREKLLSLGDDILFNARMHSVFGEERTQAEPYKQDDMQENLMLAYRHIEDARMRLGKVMQAHDGGTSVYPK